MFTDLFHTYNWDAVRESIYARTSREVVRALQKEQRTLEDFKALISPAALPYLETMARQSQALTRRR
ncbi:MAG TPA: 2-iminoacetate synthase ThiH, partial [Chitinophaga sp.]